jgi:hypothetical protein
MEEVCGWKPGELYFPEKHPTIASSYKKKLEFWTIFIIVLELCVIIFPWPLHKNKII